MISTAVLKETKVSKLHNCAFYLNHFLACFSNDYKVVVNTRILAAIK